MHVINILKIPVMNDEFREQLVNIIKRKKRVNGLPKS